MVCSTEAGTVTSRRTEMGGETSLTDGSDGWNRTCSRRAEVGLKRRRRRLKIQGGRKQGLELRGRLKLWSRRAEAGLEQRTRRLELQGGRKRRGLQLHGGRRAKVEAERERQFWKSNTLTHTWRIVGNGWDQAKVGKKWTKAKILEEEGRC
ncbi:basic helix-loop-helix (bHLH) DNA-bindingsuperfamily protein [Striga asiatica]|uniref:Basic helix-loop-helix (BHLH) DNA-bindingsuperfamily protein n=1 Tax=Striga asiatica TaxID=4170 RepID=A0A5A7RDL3_STRAF|nr:basic helix-loop-helix (bHLH) DNA-bindingsuperfamily protein [Striga asiatica]